MRIIITDGSTEIKYKKTQFTPINAPPTTYYVPEYAQDRPAARTILRGFMYEQLTHSFVQHVCANYPGKSMIHAGTFFGDMLPSFSAANANGKVYAFEPVLENYFLANMCVQTNKLDNVSLFNGALSNEVGTLLIDTVLQEKHAGGASKISNTGLVCTSYTIDMFSINDLVLIHLDVEGWEARALQGAMKTLKKQRPILALEDYNVTCMELLEELNYELIGELPGIKLWVPSDNPDYIKTINEFLARERARGTLQS